MPFLFLQNTSEIVQKLGIDIAFFNDFFRVFIFRLKPKEKLAAAPLSTLG